MSLLERLHWAVAPIPGRSMSLVLGGLAIFTISGALAMLGELPRVIDAALALVMLAAWFVGICGMIGYLRWLFSPRSYRPPESDSNRLEE